MVHNNTRAPPDAGGGPSQPRERHRYTYHDDGGAAKLSTTVVHALADVMGRDVTDTGWALADYVDPDALDRLFSPSGDGAPDGSRHVAFAVEGYRVTVYGDGQIVITPPA